MDNISPDGHAGNGHANGVCSDAHKKARVYWHSGKSILPVRENKEPDLPPGFSNLTKRPTIDEVDGYYRDKPARGVGIVCGKVSGNLCVLDFEYADYFAQWAELVEAEAPGLLARLPLVKTPGKDEDGGRHNYFRAKLKPPGQKLARLTPEEAERRTGDKGKVTAIEVKASGYVVAPGSPPACHPSGRTYEHIAGPAIEDVPEITDEEAEILYRCARALDRTVTFAEAKDEEQKHQSRRERIVPGGQGSERPGDVFNRQGSWDEVLDGSGWKRERCRGDVQYLTRPGKESGVSASIGHCGNDTSGSLMYVFTSNAEPLQEGRCYSKFSAYAYLHHGGDFRAAALALKERGYCSPKATRSRPSGGTGPDDEARQRQEDEDAEALADLLDQLQLDPEKAMEMALANVACLARLKREDPARLAALVSELEKAGVTARAVGRLEKVINQLAKKTKAEEDEQRKADAVKRRLDAVSTEACFRNFREEETSDEDGKPRIQRIGLPVQAIAARLNELSPEFPKRVDSVLFVEAPGPEPLFLETATQTFAHVSKLLPGDGANLLEWADGVTMVSREVFHSYLTQTVERVKAIEPYPHEPILPDHYYMHPALPQSNGKYLDGLLRFFCPTTQIDADLIKAFFLTLCWGGRPGSRPAWLFTSKAGEGPQRGRGVGKSTLAMMGGRLFGGHIALSTKDKFSELVTRLLSPDALKQRVVLLDNVKTHRLSWEELEALITTDSISGHRMYHGEGCRPNTFNVCITCNGASVSKDLAQRCIIVELNRPVYSPTWKQDLENYIDANRWLIMADIMAELRKPPLRLPDYTRWGAWDSEVLTRASPEPAEAMQVIKERRDSIDDDDYEKDLVRTCLVGTLRQRKHDPDQERVFIPSHIAAEAYMAAIKDKTLNVPRACSHLKNMGIMELNPQKYKERRGFIWHGSQAHPSAPIRELNDFYPNHEGYQ